MNLEHETAVVDLQRRQTFVSTFGTHNPLKSFLILSGFIVFRRFSEILAIHVISDTGPHHRSVEFNVT